MRLDGVAGGALVLLDFPSFLEGLSLSRPRREAFRHAATDFPSFWEGPSLRPVKAKHHCRRGGISHPFFGGTFIEANHAVLGTWFFLRNFPSFWEGPSLRPLGELAALGDFDHFPSFWEGLSLRPVRRLIACT